MELPSLLAFQPRYYRGGPIRHHLALLYDLVATQRPRRLVVDGFGNGEAFFTLCQAVRETGLDCRCIAIWRGAAGEAREADLAWKDGKRYAAEIYGDFAELSPDDSATASQKFGEEKADLLLIDQCESGTEIGAELDRWNAAVSARGVIAVHGIELVRPDAPGTAWRQWRGERPGAGFSAGIGLGVSWPDGNLIAQTSAPAAEQLYALATARIEAQAQSDRSQRELAAATARQVWLDSLLEDRWVAQAIMDEQGKQMEELLRDQAELEKRFADLGRDRAKAQLVMDSQQEQLRVWVADLESRKKEISKLKKEVRKQKQILNDAKSACRKGGKCFRPSGGPKVRRPLAERVMRELQRIPSNLGLRRAAPVTSPAEAKEKEAAAKPVDRYAEWRKEHEPNEAALAGQRAETAEWVNAPTISFLLPVKDPPARFLQALLESIAAQTAPNWEVCLVDGDSTQAETLETIKTWSAREPRIRVEQLEENLGIAENTNRALAKARGEFVACIDHDDLLAPFAVYELTRAILRSPEADIFYSDEDRCDVEGRRHSPFFKTEWNPELLLSSMYIGHITAYRRSLVDQVGNFRKEFDFSQDYDFALRATEQARGIEHIPHVLYHWREHPASGSAGGKPDARKTNLAALAEAMKRRNLPADIIEYPTANRARLIPPQWPRVSIVIPTDSPSRAQSCVEELPRQTQYPDLEIVIVTNSGLAGQLEKIAPANPVFRFLRYDQPFNFSDKCNVGARAASGSRLIFFNDDVESEQLDWIQNMIEPLENPAIGAVAPKMLYESGKIQHAGLVTGVRGLVGTACHQWDADSTAHTNFAQSMRDVSALSGACLAMRRDDFFAAGEWDTENAPIAHSDMDLSFKIRAGGLRCVYTPFVTMRHRGHASIGTQEPPALPPPREKANVFLLKRWPEYTCHDPYFPDNVRDWLYADSPTPIRMWAREPWSGQSKGDLLFVSHDLSLSGAPLILLQLAKSCNAEGYFVTVMSPVDGPVRRKFVEAGIPLLVDPLIITGHPSFTQFAREFDCVLASTIFGAPVIQAAKAAGIPHLWWIHEGRVAEHYLGEDDKMRRTLARADLIVTPDTKSALVYQPFSDRRIRVVNYGITDPNDEVLPEKGPREDELVRFLLLGTIEYRKGQEVLLRALRQLPVDVLEKAHFQIVGRAHDLELTDTIKASAREIPALTYEESLPHEIALARIRDADVMISASRDETGPLILMEALALETPILSTTVGCVAENLADEEGAIFFPSDNDRLLAAAITRLVREPELRERLRAAARPAYEKHFAFARFGREFCGLIDQSIATFQPNERAGHET